MPKRKVGDALLPIMSADDVMNKLRERRGSPEYYAFFK